MSVERRCLTPPDEARGSAISENMPLVYAIARRFLGRGADMDELVQAGCVGLIQAVDRFDACRGVQFSTYAVPLIMGEIRTLLRGSGIVHVSRSMLKQGALAARAAERIRAQEGREPRIEEIGRALGVSAQEAALALSAGARPVSLDAPPSEDGGQTPLSTLTDDARPLDALALRDALNALDERTQRVMALRYFREYSQAETARALGISQSQVSRIEKRALERLRVSLAAG